MTEVSIWYPDAEAMKLDMEEFLKGGVDVDAFRRLYQCEFVPRPPVHMIQADFDRLTPGYARKLGLTMRRETRRDGTEFVTLNGAEVIVIPTPPGGSDDDDKKPKHRDIWRHRTVNNRTLH